MDRSKHDAGRIRRGWWPLGRGALAAVLAGLWAGAAVAACLDEAMIVFDASGSMSEEIRDATDAGRPMSRKIDIARRAAREVLDELTPERPTGLVTYGGVLARACGGVVLRQEPQRDSHTMIMAQLGRLEPYGQTPLTSGVSAAVELLEQRQRSGTVVLITDGFENCGDSPCALGRRLKAMSPDIRVHVIGFRLNSFGEVDIGCLARQTGGTYTSTWNRKELTEALRSVLTCKRLSQAPVSGLLR